MEPIKFCVDKVPYTTKPEGAEVAAISNRIGKSSLKFNRNDIPRVLSRIGGNGLSFCPATFTNGKRKTENFEQMQLFVLDFDEAIRMPKIYDRTDEYNLPIFFAYETLSSIDCNRFRVVFLCDMPISDIRVAQIMQNALMTIFPEADKKCRNIVQLYFGGKDVLYINEFFPSSHEIPTINVESLLRNMTLYLRNKYGLTHYKRKVEEFARSNGIRLNEKGLLDVSVKEDCAESDGTLGKNLPNPSTIHTHGRKLRFNTYKIFLTDHGTETYGEKKKRADYHLRFRSHDLKKVATGCKLYRELESGNRVLHHNELFGLMTNLLQVESGASKFKGFLREHSYFDNRVEKYSMWDFYTHYAKTNGYKPYACNQFCPHKDSCSHGANIISTCLVSRTQMERIAGYNETFVSLSEAEEDFRQRFKKAMVAKENLVHVLKAQVGLGKTQTILELLADTSLRVLVAVPTLELMHEIHTRAANLGVEMTESPSLRDLMHILPDEVWKRIERYYDSGKSPMPYIKRIIEKNESPCVPVLQKFLKKLAAFYNCESHAITTHKRLLSMDVRKYDAVIIDEDIIFNSIFRNKISISASDMKKLKKKVAPESAIAEKIRKCFKHAKTDEFFELSKIDYNKDDFDDKPTGINIPSFCAAEHFCFRKAADRESNTGEDCISFIAPVDFKRNIENAKVIMVSATADEEICKAYFGKNKVNFHECKKAKYAGTLKQYHNRPYSRADIAKDTSIFSKIEKFTGIRPTITFKKFKHLLTIKMDMHIGNTEGRDTLKGKDINVVATPHQPEWIYKLCAFSLGLTFDEDANIKPGLTVNRNGYRFRIASFEDDSLRMVQLYIIEAELEQSVGRARLLREACAVNLFSCFPLSQAIMREDVFFDDDAQLKKSA